MTLHDGDGSDKYDDGPTYDLEARLHDDDLDPSRIDPDGIDAYMKRCLWFVWDPEKDKAPRSPDHPGRRHTGGFNALEKAADFETALEVAEREGLGLSYPMSNRDPDNPAKPTEIVAFDIDISDAVGEKTGAWWVPDVTRLGGVAGEYSPTGNIHLYVRDVEVPEWWTDRQTGERERPEVGIYDDEKHVTVTGDVIDGLEPPVGTCNQPAFEQWCKDIWRAFHVEILETDPDEVPEPWSEGDDLGGSTAENTTPNGATTAGVGDYDFDFDDVRVTDLPCVTTSAGERVAHPVHGSKNGNNFLVDEDERTWRCWRHECTGNALQLLAVDEGIVGCGEWHALGDDEWHATFEAARERGVIPETTATPTRPTSADDGAATASTAGTDPSPTDDADDDPADPWARARMLFDSDANGSTTSAYHAVATALLDEHTFACVRDSGELYWFNPEAGFYRRKGETFLSELLAEELPGYLNVNRLRNVREQVKALSYVAADDFTPPEGKVLVANGALDLETRELYEPRPEWYFTAQLPVEYDPDAECPTWRSFLDDTVPDADERATLAEFTGYTLEGWHQDLEKNPFVVGPRRAGKSTFSDVFSALFGPAPATVTLSPQQIADAKHDGIDLLEAQANVRNDINSTKIDDSGALKTVFSGEPYKGERKYQDNHYFRPTAKHLFTANWLPRVVGEDESLFRRIIIVEFPNKVPEDEVDPTLKSTLKEELSGVLNWALDGRDRLRENDRFSHHPEPRAVREQWMSWRHSALHYLLASGEVEVTGEESDAIDRKAAYRAFKEWSHRSSYSIVPQQQFTKLWKLVPFVEAPGDEFMGVRFTSEEDHSHADPDAGPGGDGLSSGGGDRDASLDGFVDDDETADDAALSDDAGDGTDDDRVPHGEIRDALLEAVEECADENGEARRAHVFLTTRDHVDAPHEQIVHVLEEHLLPNGTLIEPETSTLMKG